MLTVYPKGFTCPEEKNIGEIDVSRSKAIMSEKSRLL